MTCAQKKMTAQQFAAIGPCEKLAMYEEAAFALSTGQRRKVIRHGDYWTEYSEGSLPFIRQEITRLRAECDAARGVSRRSGITITTIDRAYCPPVPIYRRHR